jgi:hypothetical protein
MVEDQFIEKLLEKGYQVAARSDVTDVLREIQFQQSGLTEADAARVGRMLNVSAVMVVSINLAEVAWQDTWLVINGKPQRNYRAKCNMSARVISVEKAEILGAASVTAQAGVTGEQDTSPAILLAARLLADSIPGRDVSH